jgi:hypothetical protein
VSAAVNGDVTLQRDLTICFLHSLPPRLCKEQVPPKRLYPCAQYSCGSIERTATESTGHFSGPELKGRQRPLCPVSAALGAWPPAQGRKTNPGVCAAPPVFGNGARRKGKKHDEPWEVLPSPHSARALHREGCSALRPSQPEGPYPCTYVRLAQLYSPGSGFASRTSAHSIQSSLHTWEEY